MFNGAKLYHAVWNGSRNITPASGEDGDEYEIQRGSIDWISAFRCWLWGSVAWGYAFRSWFALHYIKLIFSDCLWWCTWEVCSAATDCYISKSWSCKLILLIWKIVNHCWIQQEDVVEFYNSSGIPWKLSLYEAKAVVSLKIWMKVAAVRILGYYIMWT